MLLQISRRAERIEEAYNIQFDINIFRAVLYRSFVKYEDKTGLGTTYQKNGQLMGSPLSFPILCLCNLIMYWLALEEYLEVEVDVRDLPVLVNGDDILFRTNHAFYEIWKKYISEAGFELSLGKNYVHTEFLSVNSQGFLYDWSTNSFKKIDYLNTGLLTGQSKLSARNREELVPLSDWYNKTIGGAKNKFLTHKLFLYYHKERIQQLTVNGLLNLFISSTLGGLGFLKMSSKIKVEATPFQRRLATYLYDKYINFNGTKQDALDLYASKLMLEDDDKELSFVNRRKFAINLIVVDRDISTEELKEIGKYSINRTFNPDFFLWNNDTIDRDENTKLITKTNFKLLDRVSKLENVEEFPLDKIFLQYLVTRRPDQYEYQFKKSDLSYFGKKEGPWRDIAPWLDETLSTGISNESIVVEQKKEQPIDFTYDFLMYKKYESDTPNSLVMTHNDETGYDHPDYGFNPPGMISFEDYVLSVYFGGDRFLNPSHISLYNLSSSE